MDTAPRDTFIKVKNDYFEAIGFYDSATKEWFFPKKGNEDYLAISPNPTHYCTPKQPNHRSYKPKRAPIEEIHDE